MNSKTEIVNKTDLICPKCSSSHIFRVRSEHGWRCGACKKTFKEPVKAYSDNGSFQVLKSFIKKIREAKR